MAIRSIAQLKAWFKRGLYPTQEQFHDWLDSFLHKEDKIAPSSVEGLTDQLNGKYPDADGKLLEQKTAELEVQLNTHEQYSEEKFGTIYDRLEELDETKIDKAVIGQPDGVASLDETGRVPSGQLPSYVDDVLEGTLTNETTFNNPATGKPYTPESGKIYLDTTTNKEYRWSGSKYAIISESLALGETSSTAYRGDRGKAAYDHSQIKSGNPHGTTFASLPDKPASLPPSGAAGAAAGFGTPTASATAVAAGGNPTVTVTASGANTSKVFDFKFGIPRGAAGADGVVKKVTTTNLNTLISEGTCFFQFAASTTNAPMPQAGGGLQIVLTDKIIQFVTIFYSTSYAGPSFYRTSLTASASTFSPWSCFAENSDFGRNVYFKQQLDATHFNDAPVIKKLVKGSYPNKSGPATVVLDNFASTQFPGTYSQYVPIAFRGYAKFIDYSTKATLAIVPVNSQNNAGYMFSTYVNQSSIYQVMANFTGGSAVTREQVDYWVEITYGKVV